METIISIRSSLREAMINYMGGNMSEEEKTTLINKNTDELFHLCESFSRKSTKASKATKRNETITTIYTDGGYSRLNNVGGSAYVVLRNGIKYQSGSAKITNATNNVAELTAVKMALKTLSNKKKATIITDSQYVIGILSKGWNANANVGLIQEIEDIISTKSLDLTFEWIKGHSGNRYNELCDRMCNKAAGCDLNKEYEKYRKYKN